MTYEEWRHKTEFSVSALWEWFLQNKPKMDTENMEDCSVEYVDKAFRSLLDALLDMQEDHKRWLAWKAEKEMEEKEEEQ